VYKKPLFFVLQAFLNCDNLTMNTQNTNLHAMLQGLNEKQLEAVTLPKQSALILAGAGSGKTRVLTTRIAWLIQTEQVSPAGILAVTFTNKAAKEMLTRLSAMLPINTRSMWIGTFHGLCNRLLRAHYRDAHLPQTFQILDSADQLSAIKRIMKVLGVDDEKYPPKQVMGYINGCKEEGLRAHAVEAYDPHSKKMREIFEAYDKQCQHEGVVDFAELLLRCYELLINHHQIRQHYQERFKYILVDEFQDTNRLQYEWLKLLAKDNTLFAVGDDDQSIYAFRGARIGNMKDFEKEFCLENIVKLEQNYRSQSNILDAANAIISHNHHRLGKNLWTDAGQGEPIRIFEAYNDVEEANFIVEEVRQLHAEGWPLNHLAVLYRSNAQSRVIEHALFSNSVPYRVYGGLRFFERAEIKHAMAYLRLMNNPEDDIALLRVINFPARGVGARSLEQLQATAREQNCSLWQAAINQVGHGQPGRGVSGFVSLIKKMQDDASGLSLAEMTELATTESGLKNFYLSEKEGADRIANLDELVNAAVSFIDNNDSALEEGSNGLLEFLTHASLEAGEHQAEAGQDALQLMTVHSAKGLEFDGVFIGGLEEGLFPHENSMIESNGLEEERRLMYVAVTRARQRLYLSMAQSRLLHGQFRPGIPSRFLDEIPEEITLRLNKKTPNPIGTRSGSNHAQAPLQSNQYPWKIGQSVVHPKFGTGVIVSYEGNRDDMRVQVNFGREGLKWLALEYARLEKV
jgi:DNA helicase II / ATP-dependent DNA helicase PcrA